VESAKFDLKEVERLTKDVESHYFSKTKATDHVSSHFQMSLQEAQIFILQEISQLTDDNFSHRSIIHGDVYDVYGKRIQNISWYIKFSILEDQNGKYLSNISFHPAEKELKTRSEILDKYCP
jgi:hypothetical protein